MKTSDFSPCKNKNETCVACPHNKRCPTYNRPSSFNARGIIDETVKKMVDYENAVIEKLWYSKEENKEITATFIIECQPYFSAKYRTKYKKTENGIEIQQLPTVFDNSEYRRKDKIWRTQRKMESTD